MKHSIHHGLEPALARKATMMALNSYKAQLSQFSPTVSWTGDDTAKVGFSVMGRTLGGTIRVGPTDVVVDIEVPFLLRAFEGQAVGIVESEVRAWIDKARNGELDDD